MRRFVALCIAVATLSPAALAFAMVSQTPPSALAVPTVQITTDDGPIRLDPASAGISRTEQGFHVDTEKLDATLAELAPRFAVEPVAAHYADTPEGIVLNHGLPGTALDIDAARGLLIQAFRSGGDELELPLVEVAQPPPPPFAIVVRLADLRLDLYQGAELQKTYVVGVGMDGHSTPPGTYYVRSKARNPSWGNPGSAWARGMPARIPPGPNNPLGTRALRLDRDHLVIHGTPNQSSVGQRSSRGCIRMYRQDVEELFDIVPVDTPVFMHT